MRTKSDIDPAIARLAFAQHGVVAVWQLLALGLTRRAIKVRIDAGRLHPVHAGVHAVGHRRLTAHGRWMAAVLACGEGAALSHTSAAALWGLRLGDEGGSVHVTVPTHAGRKRRPGIRVHRSTAFGEDERTVVDAIAVTTAMRTLLDVAAIRPRVAERAVEEAERLRIFDLSLAEPFLAERRGRPGTPALARAIAAWRDPDLTRSELERRFVRLCQRAGLARPSVNATVRGYEVDFCWPRHRLVVETDGRAVHSTHAAFERDRARDADLVANGYRVVRFTYRQVTEQPELVVARLRQLLR